MTPTPSTRGAAAEYGLLLVLLVIASTPFVPVFGTFEGLVAAAAGACAGLAVAWATQRRRLGAAPTTAIALAVHLCLGPLLHIRWEPLPDAVLTNLTATVTVWKDFLTVAPPVSSFNSMTALPWIAALSCGLLAGRAVSAGRPLAAGIPVIALLGVAILWGTPAAAWHPSAAGAAIACGLLVLWRRRRDASAEGLRSPAASAGRSRRALRSAVAAGWVLVLASGIALALPSSGADRFALRQHAVPPLNFAEYATPLALTRAFETDLAKTTLMTLDGGDDSTRLRIATMDSYDGLNATIGARDAVEARFQLLGPRSSLADRPGEPAPVAITVEDYAFPWVPTVVSTASLRLDSAREAPDGLPLYYDPVSETVLVPEGTATGDVITEDARVSAVPTPTRLESVPISAVPLGPVSEVPPAVSALATKIVGSESNPLRQVLALQQALTSGYYADGTTTPSLPGHGAARLSSMAQADSLIGDDEQYATLMMLMCRSLDIPARIAMGFVPATDSDPSTVTGEDVHAWVEIPFTDLGWVPFDVTPRRDRVPQQQTTQKVSNPEPQVLQPPPPPKDPARLPPAYDGGDEEWEQPDEDRRPSRWLLVVAVCGPVLLIPLLVVAAKALRRSTRRRRPDPVDRALGAWEEIVDEARDFGCAPPAGATRRETAALLDSVFSACDLKAFGDAVDERVFSRCAAGDGRDLWESVAVILPSMGAGRSRAARLRALLCPRSLVDFVRTARRAAKTPKIG
ncbi:DUF3488 and transglutaminase-like domain-containing protein [Actinomyces sp. B33]|uniref:transglutaminase domain-containing protein n=1 Tax=Actinomyces sp. B33 TaxID=2942131 RepID=UPI00234005B8|nr:transglutaminase domain-containing protein [Actinomyces sp. B33]MDC4233624.1 DUF3488 and transglutaminase-like domain-containing protein [Actinomyces sp. B33]